MPRTTRLDVLIYAHDGRGLGHAGRSIGIGMALRRLYPDLKVLFVTGCNLAQELIGTAPLDWLKLPSYETRVVAGKSVGIHGKSMFSDAELGWLRGQELAQLVALYRPRLVLVDHTPQGKHKELVPALSAGSGGDTRWILGVRGVVGAVRQARSELARELFKAHYHGLLWYGDALVLGTSHREQLRRHYDTEPVECGYVLRLAELARWERPVPVSEAPVAGVLSIPWLGEKSLDFLVLLAGVLQKIPECHGRWWLFVDIDQLTAAGQRVSALFAGMENCRVEPPGRRYAAVLPQAGTAVIYGGYNSLMDVLHAGIPAVVVLRDMQDAEQQIHLRKLREVAGEALVTVSETGVTAEELERLLLANLRRGRLPSVVLKTDGATRAAEYLHGLLS